MQIVNFILQKEQDKPVRRPWMWTATQASPPASSYISNAMAWTTKALKDSDGINVPLVIFDLADLPNRPDVDWIDHLRSPKVEMRVPILNRLVDMLTMVRDAGVATAVYGLPWLGMSDLIRRRLMHLVDFVCPSLYHVKPGTGGPGKETHDYWLERAKPLIEMASRWDKPIMPCVCPTWQHVKGWERVYVDEGPWKDALNHLGAEADGFTIWTEWESDPTKQDRNVFRPEHYWFRTVEAVARKAGILA